QRKSSRKSREKRDFLRAVPNLSGVLTPLLGFRTGKLPWSREVARWFRRCHVLYPGFPCVAQGRTTGSVSTSRSPSRTRASHCTSSQLFPAPRRSTYNRRFRAAPAGGLGGRT